MNPDDVEIGDLLKFHRFLGALICEEMGHDWETVDMTGDNGTLNVMPMDKCRRCRTVRSNPASATNCNSTVPFDISDTTEVKDHS